MTVNIISINPAVITVFTYTENKTGYPCAESFSCVVCFCDILFLLNEKHTLFKSSGKATLYE